MRPIRAGVVVTLACVAALLGACSEDSPAPPPSPSTSSSSSTTETTEPVPEPPALPPEATTPDAAGAAAFVRHWFDLANYAYATGETAPLEAVALEECESCSALISATGEVYDGGGKFEGARVTVVGAEAGPIAADGVSLVTTVIDQEALSVIGADGESESTEPMVSGAALAYYAQLLDGAWRAFAIAPVERSR